MRISVTGHMDVSADSAELIRDELVAQLRDLQANEVTGISCLAQGADSIFADAVLGSGGALEVILPSPHYREKKVKPDHAPVFDRLISHASHVRTLPFEEVGKDAYEAANQILVRECDQLFAVWDGQAGKRSGTGSVVELARSQNVPVTIVWPHGASRETK